MPSKVVDDLWHLFILDSRSYSLFCKVVFGFYLHLHPADANAVYQRIQSVNDQLYITWIYACELEGKSEQQKKYALPMLFRIDDELFIDKGFSYELQDFLDRHSNKSHKNPINSLGYSSG